LGSTKTKESDVPNPDLSDAPSSPGATRWLHIIPIIFLLYTIAFFDRVNIGMALPSMSKDLALSPTQAGFIGGIFFWGYLIGFLAGGWLALNFGAKRTVLYCLLGWGFFSMATGFAPGFKTLVALRFLLGAAEGPLWTSLVSLLSQWFLRRERGRAIGLWNLSLPFGALLSGPISGIVLSHTDWHVMFVLEGLPAWIWAIVWWRGIPADPAQTDWLPEVERARLEDGLAAERAEFAAAHTPSNWRGMLAQPAVWLLLGATCFNNMTFYGISLWLPSAIKEASALDIGSVGWLSALPYLAAIVGVRLITQSSDRRKERRLHAAVPMIVGGVLLAVGSHIGATSGVAQVVSFTLVGFFMFMTLPLISTLVTDILPRHLAVPAIALIGGVGNLFGGFVGPMLIGLLKQTTGGFSMALALLGLFGIVGGVLLMNVRPPREPAGQTPARMPAQ
jgi:sugar phosphate permease